MFRLVVTLPGTLRRIVVPYRTVPMAAGFIRQTARQWGVAVFAVDYKVERV